MSGSPASTSDANSTDPGYLLPGTRVGFYEIVSRVGAGGFGALYKATRGGRVYALKIATYKLSLLGTEERRHHRGRAEREVSALFSLHHPNVVRAHAFETWPDGDDGYPYIIMDFVEGDRLYDWRARAKPTLRQICEVVRKISLALHEMHRIELYHRDLKSENVLVRSADGEPVIVDFGIARPRSAYTMTRGLVLGTHTHLAPEYVEFITSEPFHRGVAAKFPYRPTVDLHALGYLFYELVTGRPPFGTPPEDEVFGHILTLVPPVPSMVNSKVPGAIDGIVMRLLEKDPTARYQTGGEVAAALEEALAAPRDEWDAPFDVSPAPSAAAETPAERGRARRPSPPEKSVELLGPRVPVAAEPEVPYGFSPPTDAKPAFKALDEPRPVAEPSVAKPPTLPTSIRRASEKIHEAERSARRPSRALTVGGVALVGAVALVLFLASRQNAPAKPESLLNRVERAAPPEAALPPPAPPIGVAAPPPVETTAEKAVALPREAPKPKKEGSKSDAAKVDALLRATYTTRPTVPDTAPPPAPQPKPDLPPWLKRAVVIETDVHGAQPAGPKTYGVPMGAHIQAKLLSNLDSRTIANGPVEAVLQRPFFVQDNLVFPSHTMVYGRAQVSNGRFVLELTRLRLPDETEIPFKGLAMDRGDGKPGLAAGRRIVGERPQGDSTVRKVAQSAASTLVGHVGNSDAQQVGQTAAQGALGQQGDDTTTMSGDVLLLDGGGVFDVFVSEAF